MKRTADVNSILRPLRDTPNQAYLSNAVQVADILEWILQQVGVAKVWQTSFSISEEFLRRLFFICKANKVSRINLVLDHKATKRRSNSGRSSPKLSSAHSSMKITPKFCSSRVITAQSFPSSRRRI